MTPYECVYTEASHDHWPLGGGFVFCSVLLIATELCLCKFDLFPLVLKASTASKDCPWVSRPSSDADAFKLAHQRQSERDAAEDEKNVRHGSLLLMQGTADFARTIMSNFFHCCYSAVER